MSNPWHVFPSPGLGCNHSNSVFSTDLARLLKRRGLIAIERLMGMVLTAIATKMVLTGIRAFFVL